MPKPIEAGTRYVPGLDGIRAIAVLFVIAYHLNVPHAGGGMLGVGVFFTLSGYLITDLLLSHWRRHGSLGLGQFWIRRARRLLPALFLMLAAVSVWVALFDSSQLSGVRRQVWGAVLYVSNWSTIEQNGSYFARFAPPLPLDHLWSLAIEEQFYLVWPLLLLAGIWFVRSRRRMALVALVLAGASALAMALLYHRGYDPTRAYEGTDTRAFGLLIGCALAMVWPMRPRPGGPRQSASRVLDAVGLAGLAGIVGLVVGTSTLSPFLYPYGFLLLSFATAALLVAVVNPAGTVGAALGWTPLRWIGVRSYGIYLWHWPIVVLLIPAHNTFDAAWAAVAVAVTLVVSALSWRFVEEPVRRGALGRLWRGTRAGAGRIDARRHALALSSFAAAALLVCALGLSGMLPAASAGDEVNQAGRLKHVRALTSAHTEKAALRVRTHTPTRTSCSSAVYIGDSTSAGETTAEYILNPRLRLQPQMAKVGVEVFYPEIEGARSIVETYQNFPNAPTVAERHISDGFDGCWVVAMGTQDVDNAYDGGPGYAARINKMMKVLGNRPVMWVSAVTILRSGDSYLSRAYNEERMQAWNRVLLKTCARHPNMRIFDWGAHVRTQWFVSDGIHYNDVGNIAKAHLTSRALAHAFPAGGPPSRTCVVR